jgi:hypothetical protein
MDRAGRSRCRLFVAEQPSSFSSQGGAATRHRGALAAGLRVGGRPPGTSAPKPQEATDQISNPAGLAILMGTWQTTADPLMGTWQTTADPLQRP